MDIIQYLLNIIQYLSYMNRWLVLFICRYIPLKQWTHDDSHSPKHQKFKVDRLPKILYYEKWDYIPYLEWRYGKKIKPVARCKECDIPNDCACPRCNAPKPYLYKNNGSKGQILCKVCSTAFSPEENRFAKPFTLRCPYCSRALVRKKERKRFAVHKCVNPKCPYYLHNLKKVDKEDLREGYDKNKYKLHYIYREFTVDFFRMDLKSLPKGASSLQFTKHSAHVMSLRLTLRKTSQSLKGLYGIRISHQQVANYCRTAAMCVKPFVNRYDYQTGSTFTADETYIKVRGVKGYVWLIMDAAKRSIIGCQASDNRGVGPCILAFREQNFITEADGDMLYREARALAIRRIEESTRTETDFEIVLYWWDKLDANRERKERDHETGRSAVPLEWGAYELYLSDSPPYDMILRRLMLAGDFLDIIFDHPETIHELVTDADLSKICSIICSCMTIPQQNMRRVSDRLTGISGVSGKLL